MNYNLGLLNGVSVLENYVVNSFSGLGEVHLEMVFSGHRSDFVGQYYSACNVYELDGVCFFGSGIEGYRGMVIGRVWIDVECVIETFHFAGF